MIDTRLEQLFAHLHQGGTYAYYSVFGAKGFIESSWHQVGNNGTTPKGMHVYFGVHPTGTKRGKNQRARTADVTSAGCLFGEFDAKDFGNDKQACLKHIEGLPLPPSVIIDSGGGYHCFWLLDQPFVIRNEEDRKRIDRVQKAWVAFVHSDDGAKDLARILRVPGTMNNKYTPARPVTFISTEFDTLYDLDDLEAISYLPPAPEPVTVTTNNIRVGTSYAKAALDGEISRVRSARESTRNTTLNKAAYSLGQLVGTGALDRATTENELLNAALAVELPEREAQRTIQSGLTAGIAKPRQLPSNGRADPGATVDMNAAPEDAPAPARTFNESTCTDTGNADRFVKQHGAKVRYVPGWGWVIYTGKRWEIDEHNHILKLAKATARSIYAAAAEAASDEVADKLAKWAKESLGRARLEAMVFLARPELAASTDDFDADPFLLNCLNGTLDLRSGELHKHRPEDLITRISGADYDPDAPRELWLKSLRRVQNNDQKMIDYLQRAAGYTSTGDTSEHGFFFLHGVGRNGKTTVTETLQAALGDYAGRVRSDTLLNKRDTSIPNDLASLSTARMVIASELPEGKKLDEPLIKDLTGGDTMKVRFLHKEFFYFKPQAKIWMFGNHKPTVTGTDEGIWSRVNLIPFEVVIPKEDRDTHLGDKLRAELPGILAWIVEGCKAWMTQGLNPPDKVRAATNEYRAEMDLLAQFIAECCIENENAVTSAAPLYKAYSDWASHDGVTKTEFGKRLKERGFKPDRGTKGQRTWRGIGLIDEGSTDHEK
jgi:putative DNA primase/helicase